MPQLKMPNGSGHSILINTPVKLHATKKGSFDIAQLGDIVIGTTAQQVSSGGWCLINPIGTVFWDNVLNKPPRGIKTTIDIDEPAGPNVVGDLWVIPSQT
jgi:hypothetical protein